MSVQSFFNNFPYEKGEKVLVNTFSFISTKKKTTYVGVLTNTRFIFKQSERFSATGYSFQDGLGEADFVTIPLNQLRGLKVRNGRLVINGDIYGDGKHQSSDFGSFGKGTFGGLSYSTSDEVNNRLLEELSALGKEYGFYLYTPDHPSINTADETQQKRLNNIVGGEFKAALGIAGALAVVFIGLGLIVGAIEDNSRPNYQPTTYESTY